MWWPSKLTMLILVVFQLALPSGTVNSSGKKSFTPSSIDIWKDEGTMEECYEHKLCHKSGPRTGGGYTSSQTLQICADMYMHRNQRDSG